MADELTNPLLRTGALVEVLRALTVRESVQGQAAPSLGYLMEMLVASALAASAHHEALKECDTESNWRELRALGVELAALNLQIVRIIDRQKMEKTT